MSTISPNMGLIVSTIAVDSGLAWETNLNASLSILDGHDHTTGKGVPIPSSGLNINSDLTFVNNNATNLRTTRYTSQSAVLSGGSDLDCLYVVGVDLYYNDGNGNHVRMTQSGGVAGSPGSISNLTSPASAAYVSASSSFVWQSAANTSANMDAASLILRNLTASSKGLTLNPPNAMAADYSLILPSLPGSTSFMTIDATGAIAAGPALSLGIDTANIANGAVTYAKRSALNYYLSSSCGTFSTSSSSYVAVTNLSSPITTSGRPVQISLIPDGNTSELSVLVSGAGAGASVSMIGIIEILGGSVTSVFQFGMTGVANSVGTFQAFFPLGGINTVDFPSSGANLYTAYAKVSSNVGTASIKIIFAKLLAYEL